MENERKVLAELMDKVKEAKEVLGVDVIVTLGGVYHPREVRVLPGARDGRDEVISLVFDTRL